jgi:TP901 family phage tail tape measure protein
MADNGVVDKVAARLSLDISPAKQALLELTQDVKNFGQEFSATWEKEVDSRVRSYSAGLDQMKIAEQEAQERLKQIRLDGATQRLMALTMLQQKLEQSEQAFTLKQEILQKQADQRLEQESERHYQQLLQNEEYFQERMSQLKARGQNDTNSSLGLFSSGNTVVKHVAADLAAFAILNDLSKIPQTIEDISGSMTKLKQVLELSDQIKGVQQLNDALQQLQEVAERQAVLYGQDVSTVLDVMTEAGRRFKDIPSIIVATDNALQAMIADNVDAQTAIKGEEALMAQFGLTLQETRDAWAKLTVASHEFLTDTSGIIDALERSGSAFHGMKINTDGAIASVVALAQESGRTGSVVGNTFKSLITTLESNKGVEALHQLGIEARLSNGQLENGLTILGKLQEKWPQLSEASRQAFAEILSGGRYQINQLLTFLNDTSGTYVKALEAMKKATQETQQQLVESAMESLPAQIKMTSASLQVVANQFANVTTPAMMQFFALLRSGTEFIGQHANSIEHLMGMGMKAAEAYVAWRVGLQLYTAATQSATLQNAALQMSLFKLEVQSGGASRGLQLLAGTMGSVASSAAVVTARIAALVAVVGVFNSMVARGADPLAAKENDLKAQLDALEKEKNMHSLGDAFNAAWQPFKTILTTGDIERGIKQIHSLNEGASGDIDKKIADVKKQLEDVQNQRKNQQLKEYEDYQKMVNDMLAKASQIHPDIPAMSNGPENIMPSSGKEESASQFALPYRDYSYEMKYNLDPYINANKQLESILSQLSNQQQIYADLLKYGATNTNLAADSTKLYQERISALKADQESLHATNDQIRADMAAIQAKVQSLNPSGADLTSLDQGRQDAIRSLQQEYDQLAQQADENGRKWWDTQRQIVQATTDWLSALYQLQANGLKPLDDQMHANDNALKLLQSDMSLLNNEMNKHMDNAQTLTKYLADYHKEVDLLNQQNTLLSEKNQKLTADNEELKKQIDQITQLYREGKITLEAYDAAMQSLNHQTQNNSDAINQNSLDINQNIDTMQKAADTIESMIIEKLKSGYETEQKLQEQQLQDRYEKQKAILEQEKQAYQDATDAEIQNLQDQRDAIEATISALEAQWQAQDEVNKLTDLQNQLANEEANQNIQYIGADGTIHYTYDVQKVTDLQKQIADEQTKIQRDAQKQQLEDQKNTLDKEIQNMKNAEQEQLKIYDQQLKDLEDTYNQQKQQLDEYWSYRLQQDQLQQEADNLILKNGTDQALQIADSFATQMITKYNTVTQAAQQAAAAFASSMGLVNASDISAGGGVSDTGSSGSSMSYLDIRETISNYGKAWAAATDSNTKNLIHEKLAEQLRGTGAKYNDSTGEWTLNGEILNGPRAGQIASMDTGGYIPPGKEGFVYLHQNEVVVNSPMVERWNEVINNLPRMTVPSFSMPSTVVQTIHIEKLEFPNVRNVSDAMDISKRLAGLTNSLYMKSRSGGMTR